MAGDLTGIQNEGEYFSAHYFQERLAEDLGTRDEDTKAHIEATLGRLCSRADRSAGSICERPAPEIGTRALTA
jgi:hypothetical protein